MIQSGEHQERVAIVTGGSGGIGKAIVSRLLSEGTKVCVLDTDAQPWTGRDHSVANVRSITFVEVDVSKEDDVHKAFEGVGSRDGRIDYLVCCAAVFPRRSFLDLGIEEWKKTLDVNLTGTFLCCRSALRYMREQEFGRIVLFSSMLARTGSVNGGHYAASKGGILGLARTLALEVACENIRVNTVSPGITDTPQPRAFLSAADIETKKAQIPLGRIGHVDDMVETCLFLLSDESSYFTGQDIRVNGGSPLW
jgi:NAD(P)-dependent dehydrogenase (short-subunit alcohol dehydrogenase family)